MRIRVEFSSHAEYQLLSLALAIGAVVIVCLALFSVRKRGKFRSIFGIFGVGINRFKRVLNEFRRKAIHFMGLLIPIIYYFGLHFNLPSSFSRIFHLPVGPLFTPFRGSLVLFTLAILYLCFDLLRLSVPSFQSKIHGKWGSILRVEERNGLSGSTFYLIGAFITVLFAPPLCSILSLCFLTIGDFSAAIIGTLFGKTKLVGKKSLEGSLACFVTSFVTGMVVSLCFAVSFGSPSFFPWIFVQVTGALTTTLVELLSPGGVFNDNLTIPPASALTMTAIARLYSLDLSL